ncbi:unnamed protein product [Leptidea sinapis]|uniref:Uncharacterized protein n=1 Tax=Leptidea sinapis TaxID=189913 RepID=A0A5E4PWG1_9NEOP|nr:unnamed protein product [Leptidea sinapis]
MRVLRKPVMFQLAMFLIAEVMNIPYLELAEPDEGYHGLIKENETLVEVRPTIRARGPLCSFLILNNKHHGEAPFEVCINN